MTRAIVNTGPTSVCNRVRFHRDLLLELLDPSGAYSYLVPARPPLLPKEYATLVPQVDGVRRKVAEGDRRAAARLAELEALWSEVAALRARPLPAPARIAQRFGTLKAATNAVRSRWRSSKARKTESASPATQIELLEREVARDAERAAVEKHGKLEREQVRAEYWRQIAEWTQALKAMRSVLGEDVVGCPAREDTSRVTELAERAGITYRPPSGAKLAHRCRTLRRHGQVQGDIFWIGWRSVTQ